MSWLSNIFSSPASDVGNSVGQLVNTTSRTNWLEKLRLDNSIDEITRQELIAKINTTSNFDEVSNIYTEASAGKGIYGKRLKNEQLARAMTDIPGQKQLFLSNQQRVAAGQATLGFGVAQSGPLLTGSQQQNINPMSPMVIKR